MNGQGMRMLDATFGRGGHTRVILKCLPELSVIAIDMDKQAVEWGIKNFFSQKLYLHHGNFRDILSLGKYLNFNLANAFDIIIMDLGVSSPQLDDKERGFSFYQKGPLDMRMNQMQDLSARDIINTWNAEDLRDLFYYYGEIHHSRRVIANILRTRKKQAIADTQELSTIIEKSLGWKKKGKHPATPYFLALRLKVNRELENLKSALPNMISVLKPNGRLFVLSFHSLEDKIVKQVFKVAKNMRSKNKELLKKVFQASREEIKNNPRSRSARLRIFEKD